MTFQRPLLPDPRPDVDRLLYLRVDLVVREDVAELYGTDLTGKPRGVLLDLPMRWRVERGRPVPDWAYRRAAGACRDEMPKPPATSAWRARSSRAARAARQSISRATSDGTIPTVGARVYGARTRLFHRSPDPTSENSSTRRGGIRAHSIRSRLRRRKSRGSSPRSSSGG